MIALFTHCEMAAGLEDDVSNILEAESAIEALSLVLTSIVLVHDFF